MWHESLELKGPVHKNTIACECLSTIQLIYVKNIYMIMHPYFPNILNFLYNINSLSLSHDHKHIHSNESFKRRKNIEFKRLATVN